MATVVQSREVASRWSETTRLISAGWIAPVCLLVLAPLPFIALRAEMLWQRPHYQFFPFMPLGAAVLAWAEFRRLGPLSPGRRWAVSSLVFASWSLLALATFLVSTWLGSLAALVMVAATIVTIGGRTLLRALLPAWAFLGLAVGLPLRVDQDLISRLQALTSRVSSGTLDSLGVFHVMEGNVVRIPGRAFGVEEACSGIYSLFSILFCTLFFVLWTRRRSIRAIVTMVLAAGWVLGGNVVRVVAVVYLESRWGVDVSQGWPHEVLSLAAFSATLMLIASTDGILDLWPALVQICRVRRRKRNGRGQKSGQVPAAPPAVPTDSPPSAIDTGTPISLSSLGETWLFSWRVGASFALLGLVQVMALLDVPRWQSGGNFRFASLWSNRTNAIGPQSLQLDSLPAQSGSFQREEFKIETRTAGSTQGEMSRYWRYRFGDSTAIVSVDFPFQGWHELPGCYRSQGWKIVAREREPDETPAGGGGVQKPVVSARLAKGPGQHGYLLFGLFDQTGNFIEPVAQDVHSLFGRRLAYWLNVRSGNRERDGSDSRSPFLWSYQVQLFIESEYPLAATEEDEARSFFREVRSAVRSRCSGTGEIGS